MTPYPKICDFWASKNDDFQPDFDSNGVDKNGVHNNDVDINGVDIPTFEKNGVGPSPFFSKDSVFGTLAMKMNSHNDGVDFQHVHSKFTASQQQVNSQWTASEQP